MSLPEPGAVNARDHEGRTPLMRAVLADDLNLVRLLMSDDNRLRVDLFAADAYGHTALDYAKRKAVRDLLDLRAQRERRLQHGPTLDGWHETDHDLFKLIEADVKRGVFPFIAGSGGEFGGGIYFAQDGDGAHCQTTQFGKGFRCLVKLGRTIHLRTPDARLRFVKDFDGDLWDIPCDEMQCHLAEIKGGPYDSVSCTFGTPEYVVYSPSQVEVLERYSVSSAGHWQPDGVADVNADVTEQAVRAPAVQRLLAAVLGRNHLVVLEPAALVVYQTPDMQVVRTEVFAPQEPPLQLAISADGRRVHVATTTGYDVYTAQLKHVARHEAAGKGLEWRASSGAMACIRTDGELVAYDLQETREMRPSTPLDVLLQDEEAVSCWAMSDDAIVVGLKGSIQTVSCVLWEDYRRGSRTLQRADVQRGNGRGIDGYSLVNVACHGRRILSVSSYMIDDELNDEYYIILSAIDDRGAVTRLATNDVADECAQVTFSADGSTAAYSARTAAGEAYVQVLHGHTLARLYRIRVDGSPVPYFLYIGPTVCVFGEHETLMYQTHTRSKRKLSS